MPTFDGVVEVKSFQNRSKLEKAKTQAIKYAKQLDLSAITLAVFTPVEDEETLAKLSGKSIIDEVRLNVVAIGWV